MSSLGPCNVRFEEGWVCGDDYLPCFKDCCRRGQQFCHFGAQRCQFCHTRVGQCGNNSRPWECDAFCLQQRLGKTSGCAVEGVSHAYLYSTYALATVVVVLAMVLVADRCRQKRPCARPTTHSHSQSSDSSADGKLSTDITSELSTISTFHETTLQAEQNDGEKATFAARSGTPSTLIYSSPSNATETPPPDETPKRQSTVNPIRGHNDMPPEPGNASEEGEPLIGGASDYSTTVQERAQSYCDPRLCNIMPTGDNDKRIIHTGHVYAQNCFTADN